MVNPNLDFLRSSRVEHTLEAGSTSQGGQNKQLVHEYLRIIKMGDFSKILLNMERGLGNWT